MSSLELFEKFLAIGTNLGKSGDALSAWVEEKVTQETKKEEKREKEEKLERKEREERDRQERKEKEDKDRALEYERLRVSQPVARSTAPQSAQSTTKPKLPPLTDPSQVDLYLERFERYATSVGWKHDDWASCLANLLQGESLSVFLSLSSTESADYKTVKQVLLRRFNCDKNGFKSKFFSVKPQPEEDFGTYINRARRYFDRWLELSSVSTFDELAFFICSEVSLQTCEEEFVAYIKDRTPTDMAALKSVATSSLTRDQIARSQGNRLLSWLSQRLTL